MDEVDVFALRRQAQGESEANGREHGSDLAALARLYEELGRPDQAVTIYQEALACELTEPTSTPTAITEASRQSRSGATQLLSLHRQNSVFSVIAAPLPTR